MKLEIDMPEHHYNNIIAFDSVSLGRVPYKGIIMYAINAIKHGKVLEQEPKKGHWIDKSHLLGSCGAKCTACGKRASGYVTDDGFSIKYNFYDFCPNCGAKMDKEDNNDKGN